MEPFDTLEEHAASITAAATVTLAIVTIVYVRLTNQLVRRQDIGQKREIVEKLYKPLTTALSEQALEGSAPDIRVWSRFKEKQPFLANHHLIPNGLRVLLDALEDEAPAIETGYDAIIERIRALAVTEFGMPEGTPTEGLQLAIDWSVPGRFGDNYGYMTQLWSLVLDGRSFHEKAKYYRFDSASSIRFREQPAKVEEIEQYINRFNDLIAKDDGVCAKLGEYREYMNRVIKASERIDAEMVSASRV